MLFNYTMRSRFLAVLSFMLFASPVFAQSGSGIQKVRDASKRISLQAGQGGVNFTIKNVDITHFPQLGVIFSATDSRNQFVRTLKKEDLRILENGSERPILSLDLVNGEDRVPIDIVFVIDKTASMGDMISSVKDNVTRFARELREHGFDYRLGLVLFSDIVEWTSPTLTSDVSEFEKWITGIQTVGGGDPKENALEGLHAMNDMPFRPIANRMAVLITDAQCHQQGENGDGTTDFTIGSMGDWLYEREIRLLTVTPAEYPEYHAMAAATGGVSFDLGKDFANSMTDIAGNITSLYSLKYLSESTLAPDSVRIDLLRAEDHATLASRKLLAMEPGRRFVFEDLQFAPNETQLANEFVPELERVVRLMHVRPGMRIRIEGHADSTGSAAVNMKLSEERAVAVKRYLMQSGIAPDRLDTEGFGATRPIASNATEASRRLNRRIEFVILTK